MSDPNLIVHDLRAIREAWNCHENLDRMIFPEEFTEDLEIKEQILFYRSMRAKHKMIIFNGRFKEFQTFYESLEYGLNKYVQPIHPLYSLFPISARKLRCMTADYIEQHPLEFQSFEEYAELVASDPEFCGKIRDNAVWSGDIEIASIAEVLNINIQIFVYDLNKKEIVPKMYGHFTEPSAPAVSIGYRPIAKSYDSILHLNALL